MGFCWIRAMDGTVFRIHSSQLPRTEQQNVTAGNAMGEYIYSESDERAVNNAMRHKYRVLTDEEKNAMVAIKDAGLALIDAVERYCPPGREVSLAKTKIEEAVMWAIKGLTQ
jgi:hypothetical protein